MTRAEKTLDGALLMFCQQSLGPLQQSTFCGWDHAESSVWKVVSESGRAAYLKQHRQPRKFAQESRAYAEWLPHLSAFTPQLIAKLEGAQNALLLSPVLGELVETSQLGTVDLHDLYIQAGHFLNKLHTLPFSDEDELPIGEAVAQRTGAWTGKRAEGIINANDIAWVRARVSETLPLLQMYTRVPCHRDYTARNWLVNEGKLYVIDFEHARADLWFLDVERMWSDVWRERPFLEAAFWEGYGRTLKEEERGILERLAALNALSTVVWAKEHGDEEFEAFGRGVLERLKRSA